MHSTAPAETIIYNVKHLWFYGRRSSGNLPGFLTSFSREVFYCPFSRKVRKNGFFALKFNAETAPAACATVKNRVL
jgi:hypothetical protein